MTAIQRIALGATCICALTLGNQAARGQQPAYPVKPIRIIVPFAAGGATDILARAIGQKLTEAFGQPVIVDNRPGASGTIGSTAVARSPADGYTLLIQASTFVASPLLMGNVPYDVEKDFTAITNLGSVPLLVTAYPGTPAKNLKEFLAAPGPAILQAAVDPFEPPMPAKVKAEQAMHFAESLVRGEPNRKKIVLTTISDQVRELI